MIAEERRAPPLSKPTPSTTTTYALWNTWHFFLNQMDPSDLTSSLCLDTWTLWLPLNIPEPTCSARPTPSLLAQGHLPAEKHPSQSKAQSLGRGKGPYHPQGAFLEEGTGGRRTWVCVHPAVPGWQATGCITCFCLAH